MASDYALMHLKFTIPPALLLSFFAYLALNRTHLFKVAVLAVVAFSATLPWDSYLVETGVWTYPAEAITGPKWLGVPVEELFFFFIQTYITSLIYIFFNITLVHAKYLTAQRNAPACITRAKLAGQVLLAVLTVTGAYLVHLGGEYTYLGCILVWASPFALISWSAAGRFILSLPLSTTAIPIIVPTLYLWVVDELQLRHGTWSISEGTKLGIRLFGSLDVEEALFFLFTNTLIVFGLAAVDQYLAVMDAFPHLFPKVPAIPTPRMILKALFTGTKEYDMYRIHGIREADDRLRAKSRSFHLASFAFSGRLRIDLVLLYSFCRMADDLIDNATSVKEIEAWNAKLIQYLDLFYDGDVHRRKVSRREVNHLIETEFPASAQSALSLLPTRLFPGGPFYLLIEGFRMDAQFNVAAKKGPTAQFPIEDERALWKYANCVAGTVGHMCNALLMHHCAGYPACKADRRQLGDTAMKMGIALQLVNIARDVVTDARMGRVYLPTSWLSDAGLTPQDVVENPGRDEVCRMRRRLLDMAFGVYGEASPRMRRLPREARVPMVLVVESYMEIGRVLREDEDAWGRAEMRRATVPLRRRIGMAVWTLLTA